MSEVKTWIITVGGGCGSFEFVGTEEEAEEMRRHKAEWEGAVARKIPKSEIYHILGGEVERLRTALEEVYEELKTLYFMIDHDEDIFHARKKKYLSIIDHVGYSIAGKVLSATTEPKQDKTCVMCGTREGKYLSTANRWFCEPCTDALPPVNANAEKMREGDGNE